MFAATVGTFGRGSRGMETREAEASLQNQGPVRRRVEAKLINWPFSPLRLAS